MKTTVDIADPILREAKRLAARRGTTLRAVIEDALRDALARERERPAEVEVRTVTFGGQGLQPGLSWDDFGGLRERAYEGRGG